ncbi:MAG: type II toxin-antitoxin system VapC family toxin [Bacteroidia bacterium]
MDKVFADIDICLDLLTGRKPYYHPAAHLFTLADTHKIKVCVSALSFSIIDYLLKQQFNNVQSRALLVKFEVMVSVLEVNNKIIELALSSGFKDFEDAVQYYTAIESGIEIFLTRNLSDYKKAEIAIMTAENYLKSSNQ